MAQLIKLESGQYLNLDHLMYTQAYEDGVVVAMLDAVGTVELSDKDLEQIDQIDQIAELPKSQITAHEAAEYYRRMSQTFNHPVY